MSSNPSHLSPIKPNGNAFELLDPLLLAITSSLDALQTIDQQKVLNIIDSLGQYSIHDIILLLQLVVYSDQSLGKSLVLEAIIEIPSPCRENPYTRFAIEIILHYSPKPLMVQK